MKAEEERWRHYGCTKQCHGVIDAAGFEVSLSADRYGIGSESRGYVSLLFKSALFCALPVVGKKKRGCHNEAVGFEWQQRVRPSRFQISVYG